MGFLFPLATLLRLREIAEQREERLLGRIQNQIVEGRQTLDDLEAQRRTLIAHYEAAWQQTIQAFEIAGFHGRMREIEDLEHTGRQHLAKLMALREQQMRAYEIAHRQRELLSGMAGNQRAAFQREQARQEQNSMDDTFASRRSMRA